MRNYWHVFHVRRFGSLNTKNANIYSHQIQYVPIVVLGASVTGVKSRLEPVFRTTFFILQKAKA